MLLSTQIASIAHPTRVKEALLGLQALTALTHSKGNEGIAQKQKIK